MFFRVSSVVVAFGRVKFDSFWRRQQRRCWKGSIWNCKRLMEHEMLECWENGQTTMTMMTRASGRSKWNSSEFEIVMLAGCGESWIRFRRLHFIVGKVNKIVSLCIKQWERRWCGMLKWTGMESPSGATKRFDPVFFAQKDHLTFCAAEDTYKMQHTDREKCNLRVSCRLKLSIILFTFNSIKNV